MMITFLTPSFVFPRIYVLTQVSVMSRELSGEDLKRFYGEVNSIIWTFVQSVDNNDKLCGVMIIGTPMNPIFPALILIARTFCVPPYFTEKSHALLIFVVSK